MPVQLYHCEGPEQGCLYPLPLERMLWGCRRCKPPKKPDEIPGVRPADLPLGRISCPTDFLPLVPRCPVCFRAVDTSRGAALPAMAILGDANAGKTVYCAVVAKEIRRNKLSTLTGLGHAFRGSDSEKYFSEVVEPLHTRGSIPVKTSVGDHRKLIVDARGGNWLTRSLMLTDMAGEVWERPESSADAKDFGAPSLLYTRESLFLARPPVMDRMVVLADLVNALTQFGVLSRVAPPKVKSIVEQSDRCFSDWGYPEVVIEEPTRAEPLAAHVVGIAARELELSDPTLLEALRKNLDSRFKKLALQFSGQSGYADVLRRLASYMRSEGYQTVQNKLNHRIAIVFAKADLLWDPRVHGSTGSKEGAELETMIWAGKGSRRWKRLSSLCLDLALRNPGLGRRSVAADLMQWITSDGESPRDWAPPLAFVERAVLSAQDQQLWMEAIEVLSDISADVRAKLGGTPADSPGFSVLTEIEKRISKTLESRALIGGERSDPAAWRRGMALASQWARRKLHEVDPDAQSFLDWVEATYAEVAYFFVSSLGGSTEYDVERREVSADAAQTAMSEPTQEQPKRITWQLSKRIKVGRDGTRQPRPWGTLFPLIWLLAGSEQVHGEVGRS